MMVQSFSRKGEGRGAAAKGAVAARSENPQVPGPLARITETDDLGYTTGLTANDYGMSPVGELGARLEETFGHTELLREDDEAQSRQWGPGLQAGTFTTLGSGHHAPSHSQQYALGGNHVGTLG